MKSPPLPPGEAAITVLIVDDHAGMRAALKALLTPARRIKVVGQAADGRQAIASYRALRPDVLLMDISMPVLNGMAATRLILADDPKARVLLLTGHGEAEYVLAARAIGAKGFLRKMSGAELVARAILTVAQGKLYYPSLVGAREKKRPDRQLSAPGRA